MKETAKKYGNTKLLLMPLLPILCTWKNVKYLVELIELFRTHQQCQFSFCEILNVNRFFEQHLNHGGYIQVKLYFHCKYCLNRPVSQFREAE